jgi:alkanesulfonate monooxygenase SsuD/methylene tetrahydromethanopterin reductase-like flavin-dependent oxidoreductase (luciferase family)
MRIQIILEPDLTADELAELSLLAEASGIDGIWVQNYASAPDPFMTLVPTARASSRIQLGVVLVSPQELHPLKLATSLLTLHEMSGGRAAVALGRGGEWIGVMAGDFRPDVAALRDALVIVRSAARAAPTRPVSHEGTHYRSRSYRSPWRTVSRPALVYAGVTRDRMLAMAAGVADGIMLADLGLPRVVAERVGVITEALGQAGRPREELRLSNFVGWHVKDDIAASLAEARRELIIRAWLAPPWLREFLTPEECTFVQEHRRAFIDAYRDKSPVLAGIPEDLVLKLVDGLTITGTTADVPPVVARVQAFAAAGLDELAIRIHDDPAHAIRFIGRHVVPALR